MPLSSIQGQRRAVERLTATLAKGTVHHAYLFHGPDGVGKELTARALAQALLCPEAPQEGCGQCSTCTRIEHFAHPDVTFVAPEEELIARKMAGRSDFTGTPSRDIKVEQVRRLQERLVLRALEGKRKVAIVARAHHLNPSAQNAFLKTLEEPPDETTLILITERPEMLLPTLRSRMSKVAFEPLSLELIAQRLTDLRGVSDEVARRIAALSGGSLSAALAMDTESLDRRAHFIQQFEAAARSPTVGLALAFAQEAGDSREDAEEALDALTQWLADVARVQHGAAVFAHRDLEPLAAEAAARQSPTALLRCHRLIEEAHVAITTRNASPKMHLEKMLIAMREAR
jgi:DNA polymerase-3 subunit delta'